MSVDTNETTVIAKLGAGEYFGEMALLNDEPRKANVICTSDVSCFSLDKSKVCASKC